MWLILIEFDGKQPPTTYYTALHNLCLHVRGDKEFEPIVRRAGEYNKAVIVQEGAVLVPSESLARQVAYLAKEEGARSVMLGNVELNEDENHQFTDAERQVIQRFNDTFKKRGRPAHSDSEEKDWVVTCPECVHTSVVTARKVMQCPRCGGLRVSAYEGSRSHSGRPTNFDEWKKSRFRRGEFEVPVYEQGASIPGRITFGDYGDAVVVDVLSKQDWAIKTQNYDLLDMVFCSRRYYDVKTRQRARVECCLRMYEQGFTQNDISIFEDANIYEPIDAAVYYMGNYKELINLYKFMKGGF